MNTECEKGRGQLDAGCPELDARTSGARCQDVRSSMPGCPELDARMSGARCQDVQSSTLNSFDTNIDIKTILRRSLNFPALFLNGEENGTTGIKRNTKKKIATGPELHTIYQHTGDISNINNKRPPEKNNIYKFKAGSYR